MRPNTWGLAFLFGLLASSFLCIVSHNNSTCFAQRQSYGLEYSDRLPETAKPYAPEFFKDLEKLTRFGIAISKDNRECYFAVALNDNGLFREEIRFTRKENGTWTKPQPLLANEKTYKYVDPHFSADEKQLYFIYTKPVEGAETPKRQMFDIWYIQKQDNDWSRPMNLGPPISTTNSNEYFVSLSSKKTIYFGSNRLDANNFDLFSARLGSDNTYEDPQPLGGDVNTGHYEADVFVAPDESYLIFSSSGRKDGLGQGDLYVSFQESPGNWSAGINLGDRVNSKQQEFAPSVSADQKVLYFSRGGVIHWVSAEVITDLKPDQHR